MHLDDAATDLLKTWVVRQLENISDADSDVLADYVLALVKTDEPEPLARVNTTDNLKDFLQDATERFVKELFEAIATRSYDPSRPALKPTAPVYHPLKRVSAEPTLLSNDSRKRSYRDADGGDFANGNGHAHGYEGMGRPFKHAKRGGRGRDQRDGRQMQPPPQQYDLPQGIPQPPPPPNGLPPFDVNDPMAAMFMQQAMSFFAGMQNGNLPTNGADVFPKQRCWDYDNKGACSLGISCPYEHGEDRVFVPHNQEYDPRFATLLNIEPSRVGQMELTQGDRTRGRGKGRGRGMNNWRGGNKRSEFSHLGPSYDPSSAKLVVEQLPEDKRNEESVRDFFARFGNIEEVELHAQDKLAIIRFDDHDAAQAAYNSPEAVFGNRFVKVYWYRHEKHKDLLNGATEGTSNGDSAQDVEMGEHDHIDTEQIARRQEEAQRKHEEAKKQRGEAAKKRQDLDAQLAKTEAERRELEALLAKKAGKPSPFATASEADGGDENAQAKALKAHLAQLEAEAKALGIDPDAASSTGFSSYSNYRGRGGYRGRGRGRGSYHGYDGGWTRGGARGGGRGGGGAVMRLDNRPKTVAVQFADGTYDSHDEAIRQYLLFSSLDSATLSRHPELEDTALVAFDQRYEGETFMAAVARSELPHVGKVELSWYKPDGTTPSANGIHTTGSDKTIIERSSEPPSPQIVAAEAAYDVAEEDLDRYS